MAAINYGTIAVVPKGVWDETTQYNVANLVTYDGSSYLAHTRPPVGTMPTDLSYWQVSAQGTNKATADTVGVVKPDGETIAVDAAGTISAKKATESTFGIVSGGTGGVVVGSDGVMGVDTTFTQATELANIIAAEAFSVVLGKVSKAIATTMNLDENALLKNMLSSVDINDPTKIPTSAYIHQLVERIGMGTDLDSGDNLTATVNSLNSDLAAWTYVAPTSTVSGCSMSPYKCGKVCQIRGTITATAGMKNYQDLEIGQLPEALYPVYDALGLMISGNRLAVVIVYSSGIVKLRPFINGDGFVEGSTIAFSILYPIK